MRSYGGYLSKYNIYVMVSEDAQKAERKQAGFLEDTIPAGEYRAVDPNAFAFCRIRQTANKSGMCVEKHTFRLFSSTTPGLNFYRKTAAAQVEGPRFLLIHRQSAGRNNFPVRAAAARDPIHQEQHRK